VRVFGLTPHYYTEEQITGSDKVYTVCIQLITWGLSRVTSADKMTA